MMIGLKKQKEISGNKNKSTQKRNKTKTRKIVKNDGRNRLEKQTSKCPMSREIAPLCDNKVM